MGHLLPATCRPWVKPPADPVNFPRRQVELAVYKGLLVEELCYPPSQTRHGTGFRWCTRGGGGQAA